MNDKATRMHEKALNRLYTGLAKDCERVADLQSKDSKQAMNELRVAVNDVKHSKGPAERLDRVHEKKVCREFAKYRMDISHYYNRRAKKYRGLAEKYSAEDVETYDNEFDLRKVPYPYLCRCGWWKSVRAKGYFDPLHYDVDRVCDRIKIFEDILRDEVSEVNLKQWQDEVEKLRPLRQMLLYQHHFLPTKLHGRSGGREPAERVRPVDPYVRYPVSAPERPFIVGDKSPMVTATWDELPEWAKARARSSVYGGFKHLTFYRRFAEFTCSACNKKWLQVAWSTRQKNTVIHLIRDERCPFCNSEDIDQASATFSRPDTVARRVGFDAPQAGTEDEEKGVCVQCRRLLPPSGFLPDGSFAGTSYSCGLCGGSLCGPSCCKKHGVCINDTTKRALTPMLAPDEKKGVWKVSQFGTIGLWCDSYPRAEGAEQYYIVKDAGDICSGILGKPAEKYKVRHATYELAKARIRAARQSSWWELARHIKDSMVWVKVFDHPMTPMLAPSSVNPLSFIEERI